MVKKIFGGLAALIAAVAVGIFVVGRFTDGPMGFFSGGALASGEIVTAPVEDWSFVDSISTIEFQLLEPPRSRTVWVVRDDAGNAYIPCGIPNFTLWKNWPHEAREDGRAVVRIEGKRYPLQLVKVDDKPLRMALLAKVGAKYGMPPGSDDQATNDPDAVWFFRLDPRAS
jgi:hypothetical protein